MNKQQVSATVAALITVAINGLQATIEAAAMDSNSKPGYSGSSCTILRDS